MSPLECILKKSSYHAVYDPSILDALRFAKDHGFGGIQLAVESPHLSFERLSDSGRDAVGDFCRNHNLRVTLHTPDTMASLLETNRYLRDGIFAYFQTLFDFAERIGCPLVTIHPGKVPSFGTDTRPRVTVPPEDRDHYHRGFSENLARLIDLNRARFILCLENFGMDELVRELIQPHLDAGRIFLCWDLAKSNDSLDAFFWANLAHIRQVHLHDAADSVSHRAVGTGRLDFMNYLPRLARANVVDFCHEVRPREKALESLNNLRKIIQANQ